MGVPGFFLWLVNNCDTTNIITNHINDDIDVLYIDANCLFHPVCFKTLDKYPNNKNVESLMIDNIIQYIEYLIDHVSPNQVYIAVDGVAPMAKINQQRSRRYKSAYENNIRNDIKKKYNKEINEWNNASITPGTVFMENLHNALIKYINNKNINIEYSSYHTNGEGEHKILQHIKKYITDEIITIYGLDADLIFLSLASKKSNIYLLRERHVIKHKESIDDDNDNDFDKPVMSYVSIDGLKWCINDKIMSNIENILNKENIKGLSKIDFTDDFIFLCFILGNDFVPHMPSLNIYTGGLDIIIKQYSKIYSEYNVPIVNKKLMKINMIFLKLLLFEISKMETYYFTNIQPKYMLLNKKPIKTSNMNDYDKEIWEYENKLDNDNNNIDFGQEGYKTRYYNYYYCTDEYSKEFIDTLCKKYMEGLQWTFQYYFNECISWHWQYDYINSPFISDLYKYIEESNIDINNVIFEKSEPITCFEQLLIVLPPQCNYLLPKNYRPLMYHVDSPIIDYYPVKMVFDTININTRWKSKPLLSSVDLLRIKESIKNIYVSENDLIRNKIRGTIKNY